MNYSCEGGIEKSFLRVTDWHHEDCRVMPIRDPRDGLFIPILTGMIYSGIHKYKTNKQSSYKIL